jgi:transcriptional regulator GlxA family with amidase domain
VVGAAGLLDGRRATTHWYYLDELLERSPSIDYVADRRMVFDGDVVTTTGITASMPMMLTLIEAIAGWAKAESVVHDLGLEEWDARACERCIPPHPSLRDDGVAKPSRLLEPRRTGNPARAGHG